MGEGAQSAGEGKRSHRLSNIMCEYGIISNLLMKTMNSGYKKVKLGEVADFIMGQAPPGTECNFNGNGTVFVKAGEFGRIKPIVREWTRKPLKHAREGDVLICVVGATAGKLNLSIDCAIGRSVAAIRPNAETFDKFLYYQLQLWVETLRSGSTGSAQGVINKNMLYQLEINLYPIEQQRRIVSEIEKQFTRLDAGVAALKRLQANLKRYRASVLKAACEGKLVPTEAELARKEGREYEPASVLLERILKERREKWQEKYPKKKYVEPKGPDTSNLPELPEGWSWASLDQLSNKITDGEHLSPVTTSEGVYMLSAKDVQEVGVNFDEPKFVKRKDAMQFRQRCNPEKGDILIVSRGATIGRTTLVQTNELFCLMGSVILIKLIQLFDGNYFAHVVRSGDGLAPILRTRS